MARKDETDKIQDEVLAENEVATYVIYPTEEQMAGMPKDKRMGMDDPRGVRCSCGWISGFLSWSERPVDLEQIEDAHLTAHVADGKTIAHRYDG